MSLKNNAGPHPEFIFYDPYLITNQPNIQYYPMPMAFPAYDIHQPADETMQNLLRGILAGYPAAEFKGNICFTVGSARSGKSTYAKRWVQHLEDTPVPFNPPLQPRVIVCADNIRLALHGERYKSESESMVFAMKYYLIRSLFDRGHRILVDGTHTTRDSIKRLLEIDPEAKPIVFDTPLEECERRATESEQHDLVEFGVIRRHHGQMTKLLEYGIDNVIRELLEEIRTRKGGSA